MPKIVPCLLFAVALFAGPLSAGPLSAGPLSANSVAAQSWSRSWAAAPQALTPSPANGPAFPDLRNQTIRQVVRLSTGGKRLRLRLSNEFSAQPLRVGAVTIALAGPDGRIVPGSSRSVTFGGEVDTVVAMGAPLVSDPVGLAVQPLARIAISIYLPGGASAPTVHSYAAATAWITPGDQTAAVSLTAPASITQRLFIAGVDVDMPRGGRTIVTFGDSITDGVRATGDRDTRWPDLLAERLQSGGMKQVGVANVGISGNRLMSEGGGINALARFDRDVLSVPGASHVVVLEGVNDLGNAARAGTRMPSADDITDVYRQMIVRAHDHGIKVVLATILPYKGAGYWSEAGEAVRQQVNAWIRTNEEADGMVDFDRAIADPADPQRMAKPYDVGDALHPNDAGFRAMAAAIPLKMFK